MITLRPLRADQLDNIVPLLERRMLESNAEQRASVPDLLAKIHRGYEMRNLGVYVDNADNAQHCLIISHFPGLATQAITAHILLIYSVPEARGNTQAVDVMVATAENYARLHGAETLSGASWVYRGAKDIDALWQHYGFEPQERIFIKHLNE